MIKYSLFLCLYVYLGLGVKQFIPETTFNQNHEVVYVEGGTFVTKDPYDSSKIRKVNVNSFYISKYETTNEQFCEFLNSVKRHQDGEKLFIDIYRPSSQILYNSEKKKYYVKNNYHNYPVAWISWHGAQAYCQWVGGRLPTTNEWEFAARGGNKSKGYKYSGSNNVDEVAVYSLRDMGQGDYNQLKTKSVGSKLPNELNIFDMSGNVSEWCSENLILNKLGRTIGKTKGGGWNDPIFDSFEVDSGWDVLADSPVGSVGFRVCFDKKIN